MLSHWHKEEIILMFFLLFFYVLLDAFRYFIDDFYAWGRYLD